MEKSSFGKNELNKLIFNKNHYFSKASKGKLTDLLFESLKRYCNECEEDRMSCVLSPACQNRHLLKLRIEAGANENDLPQFCYQQYLNNLLRNHNKKTTVYEPIDNLIFLDDFLEIFFPEDTRIIKKIAEDQEYDKIIKLINSSNITAHNVKFKKQTLLESPIGLDRDKDETPVIIDILDLKENEDNIFMKIKNQDKMLRRGLFIYIIYKDHMIVWEDHGISIADFNNKLALCSVKNHIIEDLNILHAILSIRIAEANLHGISVIDPNNKNQIAIILTVPIKNSVFEDIIRPATSETDKEILHYQETEYYQELFEFLDKHFIEIKIHENQDEPYVKLNLMYNISADILIRNKKRRLKYKDIMKLISMLRRKV